MGVLSKKVIHQILACFPVILNEFMRGVGKGWMSPTVGKRMDHTYAMVVTNEQVLWIISVSAAAKIFGPIVSVPLIDNIGRKNTLIMITIVYFVVLVSMTFVRNIYLLFVLRVIFVLANGINNVVSGIYTTENCSPHFRRIMGGIIMLTLFGSKFYKYIVARYLSYKATAIVNTILAGCVFATFYYGTETPYFLIMKGRREEAEKNLLWLSGSHNSDEVAEELKKIEQSIAEEKPKKRSLQLLFFSRANLKRIFVVVSMSILLMARGNNVWNTIFSPSYVIIICNEFKILRGVLKFMLFCMSSFIMEKVNSRSLMVIGSRVAITVCNTWSYLLMSFDNKGYIIRAITSFNMFSAFTAPAWYMASIGFSISSSIFLITFFLIIEIPVLLIYSIMGLFSTVFVYFLLPETYLYRGRSLHELQNSQKGEIIRLEEQSDTQLERE